MRTLLPVLPFVVFLSLVACGKGNDPVADEAIAPPENVVGDQSANGLASPANAAAAEAHDLAVTPSATDGMRWTAAGDAAMRFGPDVGEAMLSLRCDATPKGRLLEIERHAPAPTGGQATMSLTGGGHVASLPMKASRATPTGPASWAGQVGGDDIKAIARTFEKPGSVQITMGGAGEMIVPAAPEARTMLFRCAGIAG